jgi:hypothetical protein
VERQAVSLTEVVKVAASPTGVTLFQRTGIPSDGGLSRTDTPWANALSRMGRFASLSMRGLNLTTWLADEDLDDLAAPEFCGQLLGVRQLCAEQSALPVNLFLEAVAQSVVSSGRIFTWPVPVRRVIRWHGSDDLAIWGILQELGAAWV